MCACVCVFVRTYTCVCVCMYMCVCVYGYVYTSPLFIIYIMDWLLPLYTHTLTVETGPTRALDVLSILRLNAGS